MWQILDGIFIVQAWIVAMIGPNKKIAHNMIAIHVIYPMTISPNVSMFTHPTKLGCSIKVMITKYMLFMVSFVIKYSKKW
jgi:hypothetical protein